MHFSGLDMRLHPERAILSYQAGFPIHMQTNMTISCGIHGVQRRFNQGIHKEESGIGAGIGAGFRYYTGDYKTGVHIGLKTDVYYMHYSWYGFQNQSGKTNLVQFIPMAELGYLIPVKGNRYQLGLALLQGKEFFAGQNDDNILSNYVSLFQIEYIKIIPGYYHSRRPDR